MRNQQRFNSSQTGKRIDDLRVEFHAFHVEIRYDVKELRTELTTSRDMLSGKLQAIILEIAKREWTALSNFQLSAHGPAAHR